MTLADIEQKVILDRNIHLCVQPLSVCVIQSPLNPTLSAPTEVIALENTLNGTIFPQDEIVKISEYAHSNGIIMHMDGARIWHVAAETGTPLNVLCDPFDSVSLCFSKGLGNSTILLLFASQRPAD